MLKIRMQRMGATHSPFYRLVVSDSRYRPGGGNTVDTIGHVDTKTTPRKIQLDIAKADAWIAKGAQPSETVSEIIRTERKRQAAEAATA